MNILFVHNSFPAQYKHLARFLARDASVRVVAVGSAPRRTTNSADYQRYVLTDGDVSPTHPFARRFDLECRRAEQVLYALSSLSSSGFEPDVIFGHPGWGETLPLRTIFPRARIILYCEFFYRAVGQDVGFDPEFTNVGADGLVGLHLKNAATLLSLSDCDVGVSPTAWQRSTYPTEYQDKIQVVHEGIDTEIVKPQQDAVFRLSSGRILTSTDEVVTFAARNLEPLRGYHTFMRALPRILRERPRAQILIIGAEGTSYGRLPPENKTWRSIFLEEVAGEVDPSRVHFTGPLSYRHYLRALQVSSAHVYLTYPFVLSWSLLEAMSAGCLVIGSDTAPVQEVINDRNGILTSFFDSEALAARVTEALARPNEHRGLRDEARRTVLKEFDLERVCLPKIIDILSQRGKASPPSAAPQKKLTREPVSKTNRAAKARAASRLRDAAAGGLIELHGI
jgi:glycosyltransferase involved in cell wall biosynthesis